METMMLSVDTHIVSIVLFLVLIAINLYNSFADIEFAVLRGRLKVATPMFHTLNTFVIYTGAIVAAFNHDLSFGVILMIATSIFLMVLEIKRYKKMRVIRSIDKELQIEFKKYAQKIYTIEAATIIVVYIIIKLMQKFGI
jgi:hypothetical protein